MGYSESECDVRADIFKPSGKWSSTVVLDMGGVYTHPSIHDAIRIAMRNKNVTLAPGWSIVVLEPYHQYSHPIMLRGE